MSPHDTIANNLPCRACANNLRGLQFDGLCPECGEPIANSFESATAQLAKLLEEDPQNMRQRLKYQPIAHEAGCSVDALMFVRDAIEQLRRKQPSAVMDAATICAAVQTRAKSYFNDEAEARELLHKWGLRTGDDIGKITAGLARHALLQISLVDNLSQFSALFDLQQLFPTGA